MENHGKFWSQEQIQGGHFLRAQADGINFWIGVICD
jgi:hypothetical protein